jgi:hypothetical protein
MSAMLANGAAWDDERERSNAPESLAAELAALRRGVLSKSAW